MQVFLKYEGPKQGVATLKNDVSYQLVSFYSIALDCTNTNMMTIYIHDLIIASYTQVIWMKPKRADIRRGTVKCICVVKTMSSGIVCIKQHFFMFFQILVLERPCFSALAFSTAGLPARFKALKVLAILNK